MFKTDETVRFGQVLSARTLRYRRLYGKFNEYIIIIITPAQGIRVPGDSGGDPRPFSFLAIGQQEEVNIVTTKQNKHGVSFGEPGEPKCV